MAHKRLAFGVVYGLLLAIATLAGIEFLSSFYVPPWPARALRSIPAGHAPSLNSWGMRDTEHTIAKPRDAASRIVFVGDSFVESAVTSLSLPKAVERRVAEKGGSIEAIDLGVSGTNPRSYYYRSRDVALELSPDALLLFIYAGNDFVAPDGGYSPWPSLIDESAGGSLLGDVMPRTDWLLVNRLHLSEFLRGQRGSSDDAKSLATDLRSPSADRVDRVAADVHKVYHPEFPEPKIREVLKRGDGRLLRREASPEGIPDHAAGWLLDIVTNTELGTNDLAKSPADANRLVHPAEIEATLSWIEAVDRLARDRRIPLVVFVAPVGSGDPDYVDFWKPWPRFYGWNYVCDERQSRLVAALERTNIRFVDLRQDLDGVPASYRKLDGHWTEKGQAIVAERVRKELGRLTHQ